MKNGKWLIVVIAVLLVAAGIWWWQSSSSDATQEQMAEDLKPNVQVVSMDISNISGNRIDAVGKIKLENPYPVDFTTNRVDYKIFVDSIKIIEDSYSEPINVKSSDSTVIELPMEILASPLKRVFQHFEKPGVDSAVYAMQTTIYMEVPIEGEEEFTMDFSKKMPTFELPKVQIEDVETNLLNFDEDRMDVVVKITNNNEFPLEISNGKFTFEVEDEMTVNGAMQDYIKIPPGATEDVVMSVEKSGSLTQTGLSMLFDQKGTRFNYHFSSTLNSDNGMLNDSQMETHVTGTLDELSKAMGF